MSNDRVGLQSVAVEGIWLRREGEYAVVLAGVDGQWVEVIREHADGPFSHIFKPGGIKAKADGTPGITEPEKSIGWGRGMFIAGAAAGVTPFKKPDPKDHVGQRERQGNSARAAGARAGRAGTPELANPYASGTAEFDLWLDGWIEPERWEGGTMTDHIIRHVFDRIPALGELRGLARMEAEEVLRNAIDDVIEEYLVDCEVVTVTAGAP